MARKIIVPDMWMGEPIAGSIERMLRRPAPVEDTPDEKNKVVAPSTAPIAGKESYLILPAKKHGSYEYPDLLVAMGNKYHHQDWHTSKTSLEAEDAFKLTIRQYVDFLAMLDSGAAHDGNGNKVQSSLLTQILEDITKVRDPWRSEWADARFENKQTGTKYSVVPKNDLHIAYHQFNPQGTLTEVVEPVDGALMEDRKIDFAYWLKNATPQGLPSADTPVGDFHYWYPRAGKVARFGANSGRAVLDCNGNPQYAKASLGVRPVRKKN